MADSNTTYGTIKSRIISTDKLLEYLTVAKEAIQEKDMTIASMSAELSARCGPTSDSGLIISELKEENRKLRESYNEVEKEKKLLEELKEKAEDELMEQKITCELQMNTIQDLKKELEVIKAKLHQYEATSATVTAQISEEVSEHDKTPKATGAVIVPEHASIYSEVVQGSGEESGNKTSMTSPLAEATILPEHASGESSKRRLSETTSAGSALKKRQRYSEDDSITHPASSPSASNTSFPATSSPRSSVPDVAFTDVSLGARSLRPIAIDTSSVETNVEIRGKDTLPGAMSTSIKPTQKRPLLSQSAIESSGSAAASSSKPITGLDDGLSKKRNPLSYRSGMIAPESVISAKPGAPMKKPSKKMSKLQKFANSSNPSKVLNMFANKVSTSSVVDKKVKQEKYLRMADELIGGQLTPSQFSITDNDMKELFEEVSDCFHRIRSAANTPFKGSLIPVGGSNQCHLMVPDNIDKRERTLAWLLIFIITNDNNKRHYVMETLQSECLDNFKPGEKLKDAVFMRYIRLITMINMHFDDRVGMTNLFLRILHQSCKPELVLLSIGTVVYIWRTFITDYPCGLILPSSADAFLSKAYVIIAAHSAKKIGINSTLNGYYEMIAALGGWPKLNEVPLLKDFNQEIIRYCSDPTVNPEMTIDDIFGVSDVLCKALQLSLLYIGNRKYAYEGIIKEHLWPLMSNPSLCPLAIKLIGAAAEVCMARSIFDEDDAGLLIVLDQLSEILKYETEDPNVLSLQKLAADVMMKLSNNMPHYHMLVTKSGLLN